MHSINELIILPVFVAVLLWSPAARLGADSPATAAVQEHRDRATAATKKQDYPTAVREWKRVVELEPANMDYRFQLALAHKDAGQLPEMWKVLHVSAGKAPQHADLARGVLAYWKMFDEQGLFNVGVPRADVERMLGQPDHLVPHGKRTRLVYGFIAIDFQAGGVHQTIDLRGLTNDHLSPLAYVSLEMDGRGRRVGHRTVNRFVTLAEYVLPNERVQKWTELFSVQRLHHLATVDKGMPQIAREMLETLAKKHPDRSYRFIDEAPDRVLYEWRIPGSASAPPQHELVQLIRGKRDVHRVAFVKKTEPLSPETRTRWIEIFREAVLTPVPTAGATGSGKEPSPTAAAPRDPLAWKLGKSLSLAVFAHITDKNPEIAQRELLRSFEIARQLKVELPKPFEKSERGPENIARAIDYLFQSTPQAMTGSLTQDQIWIYEVGARSHAVLMLGSNPGLLAKSVDTLERSVKRSSLPDGVVAAILERHQAGATRDELAPLVHKLHADVEIYLQRQREQSSAR